MDTSAQVHIKSEKIVSLLKKYQNSFFPVVKLPKEEQQLLILDLTSANTPLLTLNLQNTANFDRFISSTMKSSGAAIAIGGYLEKRVIYRRSDVFQGDESRCIHLGVDVWAPALTPVYAPLDGTIHSIKDNDAFGDYGPTIILEHDLEEIKFYTLYGHLSRRSIIGLAAGQLIKKGKHFSELGPFPENGDWPPHLHFQIILDLEGRQGDFPGVAAPSDLEKFRTLCPDPNLILNLSVLNNFKSS